MKKEMKSYPTARSVVASRFATTAMLRATMPNQPFEPTSNPANAGFSAVQGRHYARLVNCLLGQ